MTLPWQFEEPMGQWRASVELLKKSERPPMRVVFPTRIVLRAWWHTRRYLGMFEAWRFVGQFAMEAAI